MPRLPRAVKSVLLVGERLRMSVAHLLWHHLVSQPEYSNRVEMRVFGMKRSGNHAIINWLFLNTPGTVCFLNYIRHDRHFNPYIAFGQSFLKEGEEVVNYPPRLAEKVRLTRRWHRSHPKKDCLMYSYEERPLWTVPDDALSRRRERCLGRSDERRNLLILRDPFNTFASRFKRKGVVTREAVEMWKEYAREFLGVTQYLQPGRVAINYNSWCADGEYRRDLGQQLGLIDSDRGMDRVPNIGGGSSFDATAFDGRAQAMRTVDRWRQFADNDDFRRLFDAEIVQLSQRIFGRIPDTDLLKKEGDAKAFSGPA